MSSQARERKDSRAEQHLHNAKRHEHKSAKAMRAKLRFPRGMASALGRGKFAEYLAANTDEGTTCHFSVASGMTLVLAHARNCIGTFMATHLLQIPLAVFKQYFLFTLTCYKSWDQRLSSGLLLDFMPAHLFQFRFAVTEQSRLDVSVSCATSAWTSFSLSQQQWVRSSEFTVDRAE